MPARRRLAAGIGATALAAGLVLSGALPAGAHSGQFFTFGGFGEGEGVYSAFANISTTNAAVTPIGSADANVNAIEIWNEQGYALGGADGDILLYFWDHTTGAITGSVPLSTPRGILVGTNGIDTTQASALPDGTILTVVDIGIDEETLETWVASIDPATGAILPLVNISEYGVEDNLFYDSIATDPTTGVTYVLVDYDDGTPQYITIDFAAVDSEGVTPLPNVEAALGEGFMMGTDFTTAGALWFYYASDEGTIFASIVGAFGADAAAVSLGAPTGSTEGVSSFALAWDPAAAAPEPQLAATGIVPDAALGAALALVLAGVAALVLTRRRAAV